MKTTFLSHSEVQTQELGRSLGALLVPGSAVILSGDLGAGKTQFTKGVGKALGVQDPITSPTFPILALYPPSDEELSLSTAGARSVTAGRGARALAHFDLYRLEDDSMLDDVGYWEALEGTAGEVSLIEWGDKFPSALPGDYIQITFSITGDEARELNVTAVGERSKELVRSWKESADQCA